MWNGNVSKMKIRECERPSRHDAVNAEAIGCNFYATIIDLIPTLCSGTNTKAWCWVPPLNTQYLEKFGEKFRMEYLDTSFPLPTLVYAGYNTRYYAIPLQAD